MDALYQLGEASATEIREALDNPPSHSAVRTFLTILEQKGHIRHREDGPRYVYEPVVPQKEMAVSTLQSVLKTFFQGSIESAVLTLLTHKSSAITPDQLDRLQDMIEKARQEGR